tara:strand:- start:13668 stop:14516 length:849 start_codon:yes stop_codon:yes gene_type:complete
MVTKQKKLNIVILGTGSAIGDYLINRFYVEKHNLLLVGQNKSKFEVLKKKLIKQKYQIINFDRFDITNKNKVLNFIKKNKNFIKKADLIINTIGEQGEINNFFNLNIGKFRKTLNINFFSYVFLIKSLYKLIKNSKNSLIIVFSGGGVTDRRDNFSPYCISKVALVKLVEILSYEFKNKNIRINAIAPGIIKSRMTQNLLKSKKKLSKEEIKKINKELINSQYSLNNIYLLINFLLSKNARNISGKLISSRWDKFKNWNKSKINKIIFSDIFTIRRKISFNE